MIGMRSSPARAWEPLAVVVLVPLLGGSLALQQLGGGIRGQSLSPVVLALALGLLGALIVFRRPQVRLGPLLLANGIGFGLGAFAAGVLDFGTRHPLPHLAAETAYAVVWLTVVLVAAWTLFILWFPDGELPSRGWRRFFAAACVLSAGAAIAGWLGGPGDRVWAFYGGTGVPAAAAGPYAGALPWLAGATSALLVLPLIALASLVQRYRRGDEVMRQQARWLLVAMAVEVGCQILGAGLESAGGAAGGAGVVLSVGSQPLPMLAATSAILRHRLWEIELVVSRTLVYGLLWALLSVVLLAPALAAGVLVGGRGAATAVGLALVLTLVFQPLRTRLDRIVERAIYRHRPLRSRLSARLAEELRQTGPTLGDRLAGALQESLGVRWVSLHRLDEDRRSLRPLGATDGTGGLAAFVLQGDEGLLRGDSAASAELAGELAPLWGAPPALVVPLVALGELVGVLACGPRPGDPLRAADVEHAQAAARQLALALRNRDLTAELRDRLEQIEAQAEELRRSRQRLVAAQDLERRRIERDLHDGVQQQLVALAVRLSRAHEEGARAGELAVLAAEAEEAVFALQELGRGIFPSVLADQGVAVALRTQTARSPLAARVEVEPQLAGRRFAPAVESALYFVALEAMNNAQKHAPGASFTIAIRSGPDGRGLVLDVHDDGPGFDPATVRRGSGLENMRDRVSAVGGSLRLDSRPGAGTWLVAAVPLEAEALPLQPVAEDSRR
jgi:signal transduction histidine kinase